jgi:hypothetical protein
MNVHQESLFWIYFWSGAALIFLLLFMVAEIKIKIRKSKTNNL